MGDLRIGLAGAGLIGLRHIAAIDAVPGVRLGAVIDPAPAARALAAERGLDWFASPEDLRPGLLDGLILATPNALHLSGALAAIGMGLPVLVEKPLATTVAEARELVGAGEAAGVPVLTGHHRRHNPLIAKARAMIDEGRLGRLVSVQAQFWLRKPDDYYDTAWRREAGAGPVLVNLIHDIDLLRHLAGDIVSVQAVEARAARGFAVEDTAVILLEFANGALGTVNVSDTIPAPWSWEMTAAENPAYPASDQSCYLIGGTEGALDLPRLRLWRHEGRQGWWEPLAATIHPHDRADPLIRQIAQFAAVIRGTEAPLVSGRDGMKTLQVIEAIKLAAAERRRVLIDAQ
ncbi:Gfo/Idh/MocA family protein [Szabonella alba]|uniref:Gfo/Idh/MocA family oxidoreductase n=1 Tax=Szabonella alba TaxID=2804194 RepID=A0A8K0V6W5_9RHOB|nr:Gfo/Idh/MocA family oxidoreductase [Szabonella alba]MBL4916271.1 Gfo/Idh/MocA family oxidoreductase [Szabonella alba]